MVSQKKFDALSNVSTGNEDDHDGDEDHDDDDDDDKVECIFAYVSLSLK